MPKKTEEEVKRTPIKDLPDPYKKVLMLIGESSDRPTTVAYISNLTGFRGVDVRSIVSNLILTHGYGIATSISGFYFINNKDDQENTVRNLKSRAFKILKRARLIEKMSDYEKPVF